MLSDPEFVEALLHSKVLKERMLQVALSCNVPDESRELYSVFGHACDYHSGCGEAGVLPSAKSNWARPFRIISLSAHMIESVLQGDLACDSANAPLLLASLPDSFELFRNEDPEGLLLFLTRRTLALLLLENSPESLMGRCLLSAMQEASLS